MLFSTPSVSLAAAAAVLLLTPSQASPTGSHTESRRTFGELERISDTCGTFESLDIFGSTFSFRSGLAACVSEIKTRGIFQFEHFNSSGVSALVGRTYKEYECSAGQKKAIWDAGGFFEGGSCTLTHDLLKNMTCNSMSGHSNGHKCSFWPFSIRRCSRLNPCDFECPFPYQKCGDTCSLHCSSKALGRRNLPKNALGGAACPENRTLCPLFDSSGGYECLDTTSDLESCGGCAGVDATDCTAIDGARAVSCVQGECIITNCSNGFKLKNGTCLRSSRHRRARRV